MSGIHYRAKLAYNVPAGPYDVCGCHYCETEWVNVRRDLGNDQLCRRAFMIVCRECGNKRCPKATYHDHECTGSNEPGQPLSVYGDFRLPNQREDQ